MSQTIHAALSTGEFVSNEIAAPLLEALTLRADCRDGYILVGYPRNLAEAHFLDALAAKQQKRIQAIFIVVPYNVSIARLVRNNTCKGCGKALDAFVDSPNASGICRLYCSVCGNSFNDTADTSLEEVERLYRSNERDIECVRSHYQEKQSLLAVDGVGSIEEVFSRIVKTVVGRLRMPTPGDTVM
jgi:adenylate kinase